MQNRKFKRFLTFIIIVGILAMLGTSISKMQENKLKRITSIANITNQDIQDMRTMYAEDFMGKLQLKDLDAAYDMLDDVSKKEFNNNVEDFKTFIRTKIYNDDIAYRNFEMSYSKQIIKKDYTDARYLLTFVIDDDISLDYNNPDVQDFIDYTTWDLVVRDYSPNNYKIVVSKERIDKEKEDTTLDKEITEEEYNENNKKPE